MAALMAIRRPDGLSTLEAARLAKWEQGLVTVRHCAIQNAHWRPGLVLGGPSRILLPEQLPRWDQRRRLMHELAHPLLDVGLSLVADGMTRDEKQSFRQARQAEKHEEQLADDLVVALRIPSHLAARYGDVRDLADFAGMPWSIVERRVARLRGTVFQLTYRPHWCAARNLTLEYLPAPAPLLRVLRGEELVMQVGVDGITRDAYRMRLSADLVAMREGEFRNKYARYRAPPDPCCPWRPRRIRVDLEELHAWARQDPGNPELEG